MGLLSHGTAGGSTPDEVNTSFNSQVSVRGVCVIICQPAGAMSKCLPIIDKSIFKQPRSFLFTKLDTSKPFGKMSNFIKKTFSKYGDIPANKAGINHRRHSRVSNEYAKEGITQADKRKLAKRICTAQIFSIFLKL
jgi:hypothetical protein